MHVTSPYCFFPPSQLNIQSIQVDVLFVFVLVDNRICSHDI